MAVTPADVVDAFAFPAFAFLPPRLLSFLRKQESIHCLPAFSAVMLNAMKHPFFAFLLLYYQKKHPINNHKFCKFVFT
jgi:hypothetical protein